MNKHITFIGAGNMAEALVRGMVKSGANPAKNITVTDNRAAQLDHFRSSFGVAGETSNAKAAATADVIVLAVKPQVMSEVLAEIKGHVRAQALFVSIAAGLRAERIETALGGQPRVVRVMPNTPALVGAGASAISAGRFARDEDLALTEELLASVGLVVRVEEKDMDAVTALSGSGPAYVFYLMEAMQSAAQRLGLDAGVARRLIFQTIQGAARLAASSDVAPAELRARVTSKGGTTAAAIAVLENKAVRSCLEQAILAAHKRSQELSGS